MSLLSGTSCCRLQYQELSNAPSFSATTFLNIRAIAAENNPPLQLSYIPQRHNFHSSPSQVFVRYRQPNSKAQPQVQEVHIKHLVLGKCTKLRYEYEILLEGTSISWTAPETCNLCLKHRLLYVHRCRCCVCVTSLTSGCSYVA